jgi:hypothetical protein
LLNIVVCVCDVKAPGVTGTPESSMDFGLMYACSSVFYRNTGNWKKSELNTPRIPVRNK